MSCSGTEILTSKSKLSPCDEVDETAAVVGEGWNGHIWTMGDSSEGKKMLENPIFFVSYSLLF